METTTVTLSVEVTVKTEEKMYVPEMAELLGAVIDAGLDSDYDSPFDFDSLTMRVVEEGG